MTAVTASPAVAGVSSAKSRAVEAPGATRRWGGAMLVFLPAPSVTLSNSIPGILEAVPPTPVGRKQPLLIPLTAVSTKPGQDHFLAARGAGHGGHRMRAHIAAGKCIPGAGPRPFRD
jgi:hypothetical protein